MPVNEEKIKENNKNCELLKFERNNYFYGKLMTVGDFEQEQWYISLKRWLINRLLFGSGVVCGLGVKRNSTSGIIIEPGVAIDSFGREIVVPDEWETDDILKDSKISNSDKITLPPEGTTKTVLLTLSYVECFKDNVRAFVSSTCEDACEYNRVQETFKIKIKEKTEPKEKEGKSDESLCGKWSNHVTDSFSLPRNNNKIIFKRTVRKYVNVGDMFEVSLTVTAIQDVKVQIIEELPNELTLVAGSTKFNMALNAGNILKGMYVVRVDSSASGILSIKGNVKTDDAEKEEGLTSSVIVTSLDLNINILSDIIAEWAKPCSSSSIDNDIILAELTLNSGGDLDIDSTKRKLVYNNFFIAQMLECLKMRITGLEDQSANIKKKIAPKVQLSADPTTIIADGSHSSTITVSVTNDILATNSSIVPLTGVDVNLISTLGTLSKTTITTGEDGRAIVKLTGGTKSGTSTIIATTGTSTAFMNVIFNSGGSLAKISVNPNETTLASGTTQTFTAQGYDSNGSLVPVSPIWSSSDGKVGRIDPSTGVFTALKVGDTEIRAESGSVTGTAKARVTAGQLATIIIDPKGDQQTSVGLTLKFNAKGYDSNDNEVPVSPKWSTEPKDSAVGTINSETGEFTAEHDGNCRVIAAVGDISDKITVNVVNNVCSGARSVLPLCLGARPV